MEKNEVPIYEQVNVWREDEVVASEMLTQGQALEGAQESFEGYFVVSLIVEK